eukprot:750737-Hanusia_phi.AAC.2
MVNRPRDRQEGRQRRGDRGRDGEENVRTLRSSFHRFSASSSRSSAPTDFSTSCQHHDRHRIALPSWKLKRLEAVLSDVASYRLLTIDAHQRILQLADLRFELADTQVVSLTAASRRTSTVSASAAFASDSR